MLPPKASHLVERAAERLLRSAAPDDPAAQLLRQPEPDPTTTGTSGPESAEVAGHQRSALFAPPPAAAMTNPAVAGSASTSAQGNAPAEHGGRATPGLGQTEPPASQARAPSNPAVHTAVLERPALPGTAQATAAAHGDSGAAMLQGRSSVDAVALERAGMLDWSRTRTRISEEFRLVQRQIIRSAFGPGAEPGFSNLLLVTSARPGEGKSFMSTNLAGSIARQGDHHVLLVDADSKRDSICYGLGLAQARGLLDLAANPKLDPSPLIVKTPIERLSILPVGRERERSAELFSTKEMTRLIQSLGRRYADRLLVLDAPPCLSTSDPAVLSQVVGQILFVVEADRTQRDEIEASLDLIQACPTITLVLNKQQISSRYTFGAYSSYYSS